jgi:hypothetical protein
MPREHMVNGRAPAGAAVCAAVSRGRIDVLLFVLGVQQQASRQ